MSSKCFVRIFLSSLNCGWVVVLLPASNFFLYIGSMVVLRGGSSHKLTGQTWWICAVIPFSSCCYKTQEFPSCYPLNSLVVSQLFAVPVLVSWVGLEKKKKKLILDVWNILASSHTEHHHWGYSEVPNFFTLNELVLLCALAGFVYKSHLNNYRKLKYFNQFLVFWSWANYLNWKKKFSTSKMELNLHVYVV